MAEPNDLEDRLKALAAQVEKEREEALLNELREGLARDSRAAAGLEQVLECLNAASVQTLLVAEDADAPGAVCPRCGYLSIKPGKCPRTANRWRK